MSTKNVGTTIELPPLETLVENLRNNEPDSPKSELGEKVQKLTVFYEAYRALKEGMNIPEITKKYGLNKSKVRKWDNPRTLPQIIKRNLRCLFGSNAEERRDFAGILGMYVKSPSGDEKTSGYRIQRIPANEKAKTRTGNRIKRLLGRSSVRPKSIKLCHRPFIRALVWAFDERNYQKYLSTDGDRLEFLRGYADVAHSKILVQELVDGTSVVYAFNTTDSLTREMIASSLFELGLCPSTKSKYSIRVTDIKDLERLVQLEIIIDEKEVAVINQQLKAKKVPRVESTPERYYGLRKFISQDKKRRTNKYLKKLSKKSGVGLITLRAWTEDIRKNDESITPRRPLAVRRYDTLCKTLSLPNVYESEVPIERNGKWFFPIKWRTFEMSKEVQGKYLSLTGKEEFSQDAANHTWKNLLSQNKPKNSLEFIIEADKIVDVYLQEAVPSQHDYEPISLIVNGEEYTLSPKAIANYISAYALDQEDLEDDDILHIQSDLEMFLGGQSSDLVFDVVEKTVEELEIKKDPKDAYRSKRKTTGIAGTDDSGICY